VCVCVYVGVWVLIFGQIPYPQLIGRVASIPRSRTNAYEQQVITMRRVIIIVRKPSNLNNIGHARRRYTRGDYDDR